jgi:glycosyltransferase involved in cell wall biosynthesis/peptidoglycan/xylan/chitin deacetylase (PgdA/CDA1 family)
MIKVSVIIPTFNRRHVLARTLPLLFAQEFPAEEYEVIVVVDGSTDGTYEWLKSLAPHCTLKALEAQHRGAGAARNIGIHAASGELILFLDDDLLCAPDLLRLHAAAHSGPERRVVHGPIYVAPDSRKSLVRLVTESFYESYYRPLTAEMRLQYPDPIGPSLSVLSSLVNGSMPRELLRESGGFDEDILAAEDLELGLRLYKAGCVFRFLPAAATREYYVKTSLEHLRGAARALGAGDLRVSRKHPEYRIESSLSVIAQTRPVKRAILGLLMRSPVSIVPLLALPLRWEESFISILPLRKAGFRLLALCERLTRLRSAAQAAGSWSQLQKELGQRCPVLLYHHVGPLRPGTDRSLNISAKAFKRQIEWLAFRGYRGISPSDWLHWIREGKPLPRKPVLITFDDAYADIAEYALPILRLHRFAAAVYVVSERIAATNTWDEANGSGTLRLMTADQIRYWANQGIEFGAHSRTHADLPALSQPGCASEVEGSKHDLATLLGHTPASFAYPYGHFNDSVYSQAREAFDLAFSTIEGMNFLRTDPHLLRRIYVGPAQSILEFAVNVHRGKSEPFLGDLRMKLKIRTRIRKALRGLALRESE